MKRRIAAIGWLLLVAITAAQAGLRVESVQPDGPAAAAGAQAGDRIQRLAGRRIANLADLGAVIAAHRPGDTVTLVVERDGESLDLPLVFGARPDGSVSLGVALRATAEPGEEEGDPPPGTLRCLAWIDETYRVDAMARELELDLDEGSQATRSCIARDTRRMTEANAVRYCDNVFKVHCGGLDLVAAIAAALVTRCEARIEESLGVRVRDYPGWSACGQHKVFDGYSVDGRSSDVDACRAAFLEECGTHLDPAAASRLSVEQREFVACCGAAVLHPEGEGEASRCDMIEARFARGPCHDRPLCINRLTTEWIGCAGGRE